MLDNLLFAFFQNSDFFLRFMSEFFSGPVTKIFSVQLWFKVSWKKN